MIKKLGRIVMLAVAVAFIVFSVFRIRDSIDVVKQFEWAKIFEEISKGNWNFMVPLTDLGWGILYILVGISALVVALKGHAGFWTFIASALMLGFFIFNLVTYSKTGDWKKYIVNLSLDVICQLVYVGGIILVMYGNHREKNEIKRLRRFKKEHED